MQNGMPGHRKAPLDEAVNRMKAWLEAGQPDAKLDLCGLNLTSLPEHLPDSLQKLNVNENALTSLPKNLPDSLRQLLAVDNALTSLPEHLPASLQVLSVSFNEELTSLPENLPDSLQELYVIGNALTSLPNNLPPSLRELLAADNALINLPEHLPASLQVLSVGDNEELTSLPENLPDSLQELYAANIGMTRLPENLPASLQMLSVSGNEELTSLPENLPDSLQELDVSDSALTRLPENLPPSLRELNLANNLLRSLPENITTRLGQDHECEIELGGNPFSERVRNRLNNITNAAGYRGPRFSFSMAGNSRDTPARPLADAVSDWYGEGDKEAVHKRWSDFANEEEAAAFSKFVDRLRGTVNYGNPQFRQSVTEWLSHLESYPPLRQATFKIAFESTTSCEDRVSLTLNEMKKARLAADVENGQYDKRVPELISLARGMFRLDQLEKIARAKVNSLSFVDEIEVYLAYQVKLREKLDLPLDTPDMRFFGVSWVTAEDLNKAEADVKAMEKQDFLHYLSTDWAPWQSVLQRWNQEKYDEAKTKLVEAMDEEFSERLSARLKEAGLENNADAQRNAGSQLLKEMTWEINDGLTKEFLSSQGLSHLLE